jgi:tetratricopeptide (TPR) repeat protein
MAAVAAPVAPVASAALPTAAPTVAEVAEKQQLAGRDALSHAQTLWNGGSRDAAVDMLQQAVATAERAAASAPSAANTQTLVLLVREFGRMQLSEGRPAAVWETLTRLEPVLHDQPEMWALRANAAQRMGRHQDSVHAYMTALQARPTEQRWLLGTAVSLAALGQTASAADMADKARAAGPISKEVQTYLRQMGVPIKE